jgi:uncharacterized membrane protein YhiD involved in acid resistance
MTDGDLKNRMATGIAQAAANLASAVTLGALIGFERRWRQQIGVFLLE